jgi:hypothetical protein
MVLFAKSCSFECLHDPDLLPGRISREISNKRFGLENRWETELLPL